MAHNECFLPRTGYNAAREATANADASPPKAETPRGETERSDRTPPRRSDSDGATQRLTPRMGMRAAEGAGRDRKRGRRANEGTRRPTAPRDDGAHGRLTARSDRAGGKTDGAPRNEEGREAREPREPEGVAAGALSVPSCPRRVDNLTFLNCGLSNCKTVTYTYLGMEI